MENTNAPSSQMFSPEIGKIMEALSKAQAVMEGAKEDSANPFFKSSYADLSSVWKACRSALTENGLAVVQTVDMIGERSCLVTILGHTSGQWIKSVMALPLVKQDAQSLGSAITYCRRYALAAIVGVAPADDDGEAAMQDARKPKAYAPAEKPTTYISLSQVKQLEDLIGDREDILDEFLKWAKIDSLHDIPTFKFDGTLRALQDRIKREEGKYATKNA